MFLYICAIRDGKKDDIAAQLYTEDPAARDRFAAHYDQPGLSVYQCVALLSERRRNKNSVQSVSFIHVDIDLKRLTDDRETVLAKLTRVAEYYLPLEIRDSGGGGFHVIAHLKEAIGSDELGRADAIRKELTTVLCGDPAPAHSCALLRHVGTHNSKHGDAKLCQIIRPGTAMDITDIETFLEGFSTPQFELKPEIVERANGHASGNTRPADLTTIVDGETANTVQPSVITRLIGLGNNPNDIVTAVAQDTMNSITAVGNPDKWTLDAEINYVRRRTLSSLQNLFLAKYDHTIGNIPDWLCLDWHEKWTAILKKGYRPTIGLNGQGFYVRRAQGSKAGNRGGNATAENINAAHSGASGPRNNDGSSSAKPKQNIIRAIPFEPFDERSLDRRAHLYAKHYQRGQCTATIGCDGAGKSTVGIAEAICLATSRNILGEDPEQRCRVWLHNADDDTQEMNRRVAAFCRLHNIDMKELAGWLFITGKNKFRISIAVGNGTFIPDQRSIAQIKATIVENEIDVIIFDPLVALHGVSENDNVKMSEVIHVFGTIAADCDCAIDVCHHTRKPSAGVDEKEFNSDDARGASAVRAAVRGSRVFNRMSKAEAGKAGIGEEDRVWYIRIDKGKANYLPPAVKAAWFKLESVELLNGDHVGAVKSWLFPGQDGTTSEAKTQAERLAEELFLNLLARLTLSGINVTATQSRSGAPHVFSLQPEAKLARVSKQAFEDAMHRLLAAGRIRAEEHRGTGSRVSYLRAAP